MNEQTKKKTPAWVVIITIIGGIGLIYLFYYYGSDGPAQKKRTEGVDTYTTIVDSIMQANQATLDSIKAIKWRKGNYVDEFGDPTSKSFIKTTTTGTFSNSAVNGEYLYVEIIIDKNSTGLFLHEYESSRPAETFIGGGEMLLKNQAGEILRITAFREWSNKGGMSIYNLIENDDKYAFRSLLTSFLKRSVGEIKVVVQDEYRSTYNFTIDATGFTKAYASL